MIGTMTAETTILIPYRYRASAGAFIEAVHRAQSAASATERRQHVSVARVWYDTLAENLRALKHEIAESREWIGDLLWDNVPQARALGNLRTALVDLNQQIGDYLIVTRQTLMINPDAHCWVDANALTAAAVAFASSSGRPL